MYGHAEHSETLRRITRLANHLQDERHDLRALRDDLLQDAPGETEEARQALRDVSVTLKRLCRQLDDIPALLPTPQPEPVVDWKALYRGGGNDVA